MLLVILTIILKNTQALSQFHLISSLKLQIVKVDAEGFLSKLIIVHVFL